MKYINTFKTHASYESEVNGGVDISLPNVSYCEDVKDVHYNPYNTVEFYVGEVTEPQTVKIYTDINTSVDIEVSKGNKWYTYVLPKDKGLFKIYGNSVKKVVVKADISFKGTSYYQYIPIIPSSTIEASFKGSNTSNVTIMGSMFKGCSNLKSLDLRNFNTSKVNNMYSMFNFCKGLTSLDVSSFNTSNVTDMDYMFTNCSGLTSLDLSKWDTSKVTRMNQMFDSCRSLTTLDLSGWNTSKVTSMDGMFSFCNGLTSLDLSKWNMSNRTSMIDMFKGCSELKTIRMVGCSEATRTKIQNQLTTDGITGVTIVTE